MLRVNLKIWTRIIILVGSCLLFLTIVGFYETLYLRRLLRGNIIDLRVSNSVIESFFLISIIVISTRVFRWARFYIRNNDGLVLFFMTLNIFVISILLLTLRDNILPIFLGWEGLGITSFLLIVFYQNWASSKGGVLTLLTNRVGDGIIIVVFSYIIILNTFTLKRFVSIRLYLIIIIITFTKRAQMPFRRWLPLAIAAPTPVRALVHSSTLVTAGIWLLIKFNQFMHINVNIFVIISTMTLSVARLSALIELDAKKVVALSTLRQLGLMVLRLYLSGISVCLFHLLIHAFAKANLFIVVGKLIHLRFSQQDTRFLTKGQMRFIIILIIFVSIMRLSGITLFSGFFSKEWILSSICILGRRVFVLILIIRVMRVTLSYCWKLFSIVLITSRTKLLLKEVSRSSLWGSVLLRSLRVFLGGVILFEVIYYFNWRSRTTGFYWIILLFGIILLEINNLLLIMIFSKLLLYLEELRGIRLLSVKRLANNLTESFYESMILFNSIKRSSFLTKWIKFIIILRVVIILVVLI